MSPEHSITSRIAQINTLSALCVGKPTLMIVIGVWDLSATVQTLVRFLKEISEQDSIDWRANFTKTQIRVGRVSNEKSLAFKEFNKNVGIALVDEACAEHFCAQYPSLSGRCSLAGIGAASGRTPSHDMELLVDIRGDSLARFLVDITHVIAESRLWRGVALDDNFLISAVEEELDFDASAIYARVLPVQQGSTLECRAVLRYFNR